MIDFQCLKIPEAAKRELRFLFLAKHALSNGAQDAEDGNHANYHHEMLKTLREIGLQVTAANRFQALYEKPEFDFLITLFNRAGFHNSEMFAPLFGEFHRVPYLGAAPIIRGATDNKHFMKRIVQALGIRTPRWKFYPIGSSDRTAPGFETDALIVKPNASSASWGIEVTSDWVHAARHISDLHRQGHDVIVEDYIDGTDVAVPIIGSVKPRYLPVIEYRSPSGAVRSYACKRGLAAIDGEQMLVAEAGVMAGLQPLCDAIVPEIWPFDYGRIEFRIAPSPAGGAPHFIEVNLNCNLSSTKAVARSAQSIGVSHAALVETILCHSLLRQGVITECAGQPLPRMPTCATPR